MALRRRLGLDVGMAKAELDQQMIERLAFVRMLYQQGIEQSRLREPLSATSLLSLHDAAELLLGAMDQRDRPVLRLRGDLAGVGNFRRPGGTLI